MKAMELKSAGSSKIMNGDLLGGLECYREALRLDPDNYDIYWSYFTWLEEAIIAVPPFTKDAILCLNNMFKLMDRDNMNEKKEHADARYWDLATTYFRNKEFEKAMQAARKSIELGFTREECRVYEAYGLYYLNQDTENKYEAICDNSVAAFSDKVCFNKLLKEKGATFEQLEALKNPFSYEFPMELIKYLQKFMPDKNVEWEEKIKLLSFEEMISVNCTSQLSKLGFFTFATVRDGDYICMDLVEKSHPIYQCFHKLITDSGIHFLNNDEFHLDLTYENVKKTSLVSEMNLILFLNRLKNGYITLRDEGVMERQYCYNKYLEESGFKPLDVQISDKKKECVGEISESTGGNSKDDSQDEEKKAEYTALAHKMVEVLMQKTAKKCLQFKLKPGNPGILDNKVGGIPFIPQGGKYPVSTETGNMLYLLAQINFEQIPHLPDFPTKGILQFFIGSDDLYGCDWQKRQEQKSWRIIYHEDISSPMDVSEIVKLIVNQKKEDEIYLPFEKPGEEYAMEFEVVDKPISIDDYKFEEIFLKECRNLYLKEFGEIEDFYQLPDVIRDILYDEIGGLGSKIGGYPGFTQNDPREYDEEIADYQLLFQLDSEGDDKEWYLLWGDCGIANFFIHPDDLKKKDFSRVVYHWDCC